jgi:hypothetical protein
MNKVLGFLELDSEAVPAHAVINVLGEPNGSANPI